MTVNTLEVGPGVDLLAALGDPILVGASQVVMTANPDTFTYLPYPTARLIAAQINGTSRVNADDLCQSGLSGTLAIELARQIKAGVGNLGYLMTLGVDGITAQAIVNAINASAVVVPPLVATYAPVTTGTQGTAYTGAAPSVSGGLPPYTFSEVGALPSGLSINPATGVISGTPTAAGTFAGIQVKVTDSASNVANCGSAFSLVITASASKMYSFLAAFDNVVNGSSPLFYDYQVTMPASGGTLIVFAYTQNPAIQSVVYDPTGAQPITLTSNGLGWYSAAVPAASGSKNIRVNYAFGIQYYAVGIAAWIAQGLSSGYDASSATNSIPVSANEFLFAASVSIGGTAPNAWGGSTSPPSANRFFTPINQASANTSSCADWASPSPSGSFLVTPGNGGGCSAATYK